MMYGRYLLAGDAGVSVGGGAEHEVVEDGGVGRDADTAAHHHRHLELVPVLIATSERTLDPTHDNEGFILLYFCSLSSMKLVR